MKCMFSSRRNGLGGIDCLELGIERSNERAENPADLKNIGGVNRV